MVTWRIEARTEFLHLIPGLASTSPLLPLPPDSPLEEGESGVQESCRSDRLGLRDSAWLLPPLVSSGGPSVPQDDFNKARHVSFFRVVGGEERMLLQRRRDS